MPKLNDFSLEKIEFKNIKHVLFQFEPAEIKKENLVSFEVMLDFGNKTINVKYDAKTLQPISNYGKNLLNDDLKSNELLNVENESIEAIEILLKKQQKYPKSIKISNHILNRALDKTSLIDLDNGSSIYYCSEHQIFLKKNFNVPIYLEGFRFNLDKKEIDRLYSGYFLDNRIKNNCGKYTNFNLEQIIEYFSVLDTEHPFKVDIVTKDKHFIFKMLSDLGLQKKDVDELDLLNVSPLKSKEAYLN